MYQDKDIETTLPFLFCDTHATCSNEYASSWIGLNVAQFTIAGVMLFLAYTHSGQTIGQT
jgi:hypothetical protein